MTESYSNWKKTLWEKEKLLVRSNFSFSHSVFKRLILQTRKNQGLLGKELSKHGFYRRVSRKRVVIREVNRKRRLSWCLEKHRWLVNGNWDKVIFSDESQIIIGNNNRINTWRKRGEGYRPDLVPSKACRKFQVTIWGCICWNGVGTLAKVTGNINPEKYKEILEENI